METGGVREVDIVVEGVEMAGDPSAEGRRASFDVILEPV
jgi:hypothetical protein